MRSFTASIILSAAALALPAAASAQQTLPRSTVNAPSDRLVATDRPVPVDLTIAWAGVDLGAYNYSARIAVAPDPAPRDVVDSFPLTGDASNPAHWTGAGSDGINDSRWASRPGTYFIGVEAFFKNTDPTCRADPATGTVSCAIASYAVMQERPLHELVVVARLNATRAKTAARRRAAKIGWRSKAPLTCVAALDPSAFACTFTWHVRGRAVHRSLTVAQTVTGTITIARGS